MYKHYEEVKDSGIQWLSKMPRHWKLTKLKFLKKGSLVYGLNEAAESDNREDVRFIRITDLTTMGKLKEETFKSVPMAIANKYLLNEGDILLARSGSVGRSFIYKKEYGDCCYAGYLIKMTPNTELIIPQFFKYFTEHKSYYNWINSISSETTIENVNAEKYSNLPIALPDLYEQKSIIQFLDQKTAAIDNLIEKKEALIKLLKEKRQVLINEVVTKGLNPNVKMKDSGIEWIGEIPEHWNTTNIKRVTSILNGYAFDSNSYAETGTPILRISDINSHIDWEQSKKIPFETLNDMIKFKVIKNDILVAMTGATIGKSSLYLEEKEALLNQRVAALRSFNITPEFLFLFVQSSFFMNQIKNYCSGGAQENIGVEQIGSISLGLPNNKEQLTIVSQMKESLDILNALSNKLVKQINNLKEYRQTLIFNAVTGKIDVR